MIYHIHYTDGRDDNWIATLAKKEDAEFFLKLWNENKPDKCCIIPQKKAA
jgi:hypothetical protein